MKDVIGTSLVAALVLVANAPARGQAPEPAGVTAAVQPQATGNLPGRGSEELRIGNDIFRDQRVTTGPNGRAQLLFMDETRLAIGPGQEIVLNLYRFDPRTKKGDLYATVGPGAVRVTAGAMSEVSETIRLRFTDAAGRPTGSAEFHRRVVAGVSVAPNGETTVLSLTGGLIVASNGRGETTRITRGGFASTIGLSGAPTAPARAKPADIDALLAGLEGRSGTGQRADERTLNALGQHGSSLSVNQATPRQFDRTLGGVNPSDLEALSGLPPTRPGDLGQRAPIIGPPVSDGGGREIRGIRVAPPSSNPGSGTLAGGPPSGGGSTAPSPR